MTGGDGRRGGRGAAHATKDCTHERRNVCMMLSKPIDSTAPLTSGDTKAAASPVPAGGAFLPPLHRPHIPPPTQQARPPTRPAA